jgi:hypothetical protein
MTLSAATVDRIPGNQLVSVTFMILLLITTCYAAGRLHQWYRQGTERDHAFRTGYDTATKSLFSLATRVARPHPPAARRGLPEAPAAPSFRAAAPVEPGRVKGPRHRASDKRKAELAETKHMRIGDFKRTA